MSADLFAAFLAERVTPEAPLESLTQHKMSPREEHVHCSPSTPIKSTIKRTQQPTDPSLLLNRSNDGADILFDADEAALDDDFGDFETVAKPSIDEADLTSGLDASQSAHPRTVTSVSRLVPDLLDMNDGIPEAAGAADKVSWPESAFHRHSAIPRRSTENANATVNDAWGDFEQTVSQDTPAVDNLAFGSRRKSQTVKEEMAADSADEEWEPFDEEPRSDGSYATGAPKLPGSLPSEPVRATPGHPRSLTVLDRPSNVPPPSSLLQLLSAVFQSIRRGNADTHTTKSDLASQVLLAFRTASRIIAGRTLRWKRDSLLAQSVRIGQAGKSGGMKLVAVNKSETSKEEREVEDMIQDWSNYIHEFNGIISRAGLPPSRMRLYPRIPLKAGKHPNSSDSSKQCALCGLKRTERLSEVDTDVEDLFGEFWVEHWGHRDCCDFWYSYKAMLGQR
ncbi:hypothetical protein G647_00020 [Cladophialophora carrionii CBS 160.54]|uniref:Uncharacterized protein n=1 Tax=Cladophialophora carrionii CBS 160.54 TaxID=1279043 RepID=V9DLP4_9EURO|nr:uncharacterized protein G647_00020 [Cladophialophora carrionii CBS 160.54]ETI27571.1 hypothetical protein G647_00020 [Cladophialophora carrionii CBS 160.54]